MKLLFWGKGDRGVSCLQALLARKFQVIGVVIHPEGPGKRCKVGALARENGLNVIAPDNPGSAESLREISSIGADLFVLGGYGKILNRHVLELPPKGSVNLHGGKLPDFRGSSPLNWALIEGESSFTLSVISVDTGVDTGDVLMEKTFDAGPNATIAELHEVAQREFPAMLVEVLNRMSLGTLKPRKQDGRGRYFPLRFPDDGFILWDQLTALEIHNRIRALTDPYPNAFTYLRGRRVSLKASRPATTEHFGEPGRIYQITDKGLLVCAKDRCLWIEAAEFDDSKEPVRGQAKRYDQFQTMKSFLLENLSRKER